MNLKNISSALALAAALCLPALTLSFTPADAKRAETSSFSRTANFNGGTLTAPAVRDSGKKAVARKSSRKTAAKATGKPSRVARGRNPAIVAKVKAHARAAGVPVSTALSVVHQESGFRPHVTGAAGEIGLMQLKCQTARGMGFSGSCKALYNPDTNLRFGMKYLRKALNRGSVGYYNAGIHAKSLPKAARRYASQVASRY
ncbi:MAG: lytic transglycosylase domain-containing protein [Anderseniella sp.]|jgi:soluble lytic murein transglycosylase-like protein|nr:lytic transglycosylase domain-containing protein [Anderseniella sp.]